MISKAIDGATRRIGKAQGYLGLALRDTATDDGTPVMVSAWEPTPDEIAKIAAGAPVYLWVYGTGHPPVMLTVGEVP